LDTANRFRDRQNFSSWQTAYAYPDWLLQKCDHTRQRCRLTTALPDTGDVPQLGKIQHSYAPGCEIKGEVRSLQTPFKFASLKKKKGATVIVFSLNLFAHLSFRACFLNGSRLTSCHALIIFALFQFVIHLFERYA
jgi:hypothetical protein